jgi:hypothetical protein
MRDFDKKLDKLSAIVATMAPPSSPQPALPSVATLPSQVTEPPIREASPPVAPRASVPPVANTPLLLTPGPSSETSLPFWDSINETLSCLGRLDPSLPWSHAAAARYLSKHGRLLPIHTSAEGLILSRLCSTPAYTFACYNYSRVVRIGDATADAESRIPQTGTQAASRILSYRFVNTMIVS